MSDSDGAYSHSDSDEGPVVRGGTSRQKAAGTSGNTRSKAKQRAKERWEANIEDRGITIQEGKDGRIAGDVARIAEARKRKRLRQDTQPFQRGIIRHLVLILDLGEAMMDKDMRPNRFIVTLRFAVEYIREFFEQNPISQLCVLAMHDGICIRISELSGNPNDHIEAIQEIRNPRGGGPATEPKGNPSLQNALEMSRATLFHTPRHGTREVIIILGALLTLDPGDIHTTITGCVKDRLRVNIIGMGGRMKICTEICSRTNSGDASTYGVALDQQNLRELLLATTTPPVIRATDVDHAEINKAMLLTMGFPSRVEEDHRTLCACHSLPTRGGYTCSRCRAKVCSLPVTCPACGLTLILSTHLARSYHHLFPLKNWLEVSWRRARQKASTQCKGCLVRFPAIPADEDIDDAEDDDSRGAGMGRNGVEVRVGADGVAMRQRDAATEGASESSRYECPSCGEHFCIDCDLFCHEALHNCPGCLSSSAMMTGTAEEDVMDTR